jgi:hypothetical protein
VYILPKTQTDNTNTSELSERVTMNVSHVQYALQWRYIQGDLKKMLAPIYGFLLLHVLFSIQKHTDMATMRNSEHRKKLETR